MAEMYCSSHRSKPVSERNPQGVKGSIVQVDGRGNYKGVGMRGANELYGDSEAFSLACTPNRDSSARYELEAQLYVLQQKLDTERVLWQVNGNGGTGSGKGVPMYTACIVSMVVHRNDEEANTDDPSISIWSCTLPGFPKFLFREDLVDDEYMSMIPSLQLHQKTIVLYMMTLTMRPATTEVIRTTTMMMTQPMILTMTNLQLRRSQDRFSIQVYD